MSGGKNTGIRVRAEDVAETNRREPRSLVKFFTISVHSLWRGGRQRILVIPETTEDAVSKPIYYMTIQDAEHLIAQLRTAIKKAPRAI